MLQLMVRFGWSWVGLLFNDDDYGHTAARTFHSDLAQSGLGCVAYSEALPWDKHLDKLDRIVTVMKESTARVVIAFAYGKYMRNILKEVCFIIRIF